MKTKGQSIIEILVALAILMISMAAVIIVAFSNQSVSVDTENTHEALYLAEENLEETRALAKENFESISSSTSIDGIYTKDIFVDAISPDEKKITSRVTWQTDPLVPRQIELVTIVTKVTVIGGSGGDTGGGGLSGDWSNPQTLGSVDLGPGNSATDLDVINKIVYMTSEASSSAKPDFYIVDATNGSSPFIVSSLNTGTGLNALDATTDYAYVANKSTTAQLQIINITDRQNPVLTKSFQLTGAVGVEGTSIFYNDSKIYIGTKSNVGPEFFVVSVSTPSSPSILGSFEVGGDVNSIHIAGTSAYISTSVNNSEMKILSIANPALITQLGAYDGSGSNDGKSIYVVGTKGYLGRGEGDKELDIIDVTNPLIMPSLGFKDINADVNGIVTRDCLSFLGTDESNSEFQIWKTSDPANIQLWSSFNFPQVATGIDYESNLVYVSVRSNDAFRIITSTPGGSSC